MEQLAELLNSHRVELEEKQKTIESMLEIVKAVAHIGVDFGYGKYEFEPNLIARARELVGELYE